MISCIVLAAGAGRRMGYSDNKVCMPLGHYTVLQWNLLHMKQWEGLEEVILVVADRERPYIEEQVEDMQVPWTVKYAIGGAERQDSVASGLSQVSNAVDIVLVHDGARPLATKDLARRVIEGAKEYGAVVPAIPVVDTIKRVDSAGVVKETLVRSELYAMQTPQGFQRSVLLEAHAYAKEHGYQGTDDVSLVEFQGRSVHIVEGDRKNIKLTVPEDVAMAKKYLGVEQMMRIGYGYDIHRFAEGRPCILGGVFIDSPIGPDGHSDADVLIHALMDAMLGAAGMRDIGYYFPPEDDAFKGISSRLLLEKVVQLLKDSNFGIYNADIMVIAEAPKLKPHIEEMKENLSVDLGIPLSRISIKATTNEGLGALGRTEGIAAQAVVSMYEREEL